MSMFSREKIKKIVEEQDCEFFGIVDLFDEPSFSSYKKWLEEKKHGSMHYLENHLHCRKSPAKILVNARSALIIGLNYYQGDKYQTKQAVPSVAQYARLKDYHKILKKNARKIVDQIKTNTSKAFNHRVVVDSAPILERALASRCNKGFIGKNTLFIHPKKGSFVLLGEIVLDVKLEVDQKIPVNPNLRNTTYGGCGTCRRCQVYCPTAALAKDYTLDATKCLSYYTIENRDVIPLKYWSYLKTSFFGCDICQLVCPYNRAAQVVPKKYVHLKNIPPLKKIALMSQQEYEEFFGGTPLTRAKRTGLRRNAIIAMIVTDDPDFEKILPQLQQDSDPILQKTLLQIPNYKKGQIA